MEYRRTQFDEMFLNDPIVLSVEQMFSYCQAENNAVKFVQ